MNKFRMLALASAVSALAVPALAAEQGPYVGLGLGYHMPRNSSVLIGTNPREMEFDNGPIAVGSFGYMWSQGFRAEAEVGYREGEVGNVTGGPAAIPWTGDQKTWSVMGNLLFDLARDSRVNPYIGAGAGINWLGWKNGFAGPTTPTFDGTESKFGWQGIAGADFKATDNLRLFLEYRYIGVNNVRFPANNATATPVVSDHDDRSHNLLLGFRYAFGAPPPKAEPPKAAPPPAPPAPPAPPPRPAIPQNFIVFFDFDKSNLRTDAQKIVSDAATYAKTNNKARIVTTGHADTSGSAAYNLGLSERRANAVKAELVRLGIPANEIVVMFKGESQPLVATGDGVKEPQNRRVEIVLE
jgi:outer membrane protein OmpA-like peptidoglycan-associated protein